MIKTTFLLAIVAPGHTALSRTIEMSFRVSIGDEVDINGEDWQATITDVRFNMATLVLEANITDYDATSVADREEAKAELVAQGWTIDYAF